MALRLHLGLSRQNRWRGWCWFWVCELGFWCANVYCHHGDGAVKILCGPQSDVLVRERFSLWVRSGFASLSDQCVGGDSGVLLVIQNRWRGWCWFWVCVLGFWCANVYCHHGDGAGKILCGPQSNVLVRERFSCARGWSRTSTFGGLSPGIPQLRLLGDLACRHSPASPLGDLACRHSPLSSPEGPLQQCEKSSKSAFWHSLFFCTPSILSASKLATVCPGTKKALKRCLRAFFCCCGERGIRTPGTVTRTTV